MNKEQYIQDIIIQTLQDTITEFNGSSYDNQTIKNQCPKIQGE